MTSSSYRKYIEFYANYLLFKLTVMELKFQTKPLAMSFVAVEKISLKGMVSSGLVCVKMQLNKPHFADYIAAT